MIHVKTAGHDDRRDALEMILHGGEPAPRDQQIAEMLLAVDRGELSLDGLLVARDGRHLSGAALIVMQPDGCGFLWPPAVFSPPSTNGPSAEDVADALLQAAVNRIDSANGWLSQCLLEPADTINAERLLRNGFRRLTDLEYLSRSLHEPLPSPSPGSRLEILRRDPREHRTRFAKVIERTYQNTSDCPGLDGLRTGTEAVSGHLTTGHFLPEQWMILSDKAGEVGVLILADHPDQHAWELVYMGVVPEARGRGYGREIVQTALHSAQQSGRDRLLLAVDRQNRFARDVYEEFGFCSFDVKSVYIRPGPGVRNQAPPPRPAPREP